MTGRVRTVIITLCACLVLGACESEDEKAERHYQSAKGYLASGEVDLALVDLRRVFQYDQRHRDARFLYASTVRDLGRMEDAYGQYLRLIEQYPDDLAGRVALAEMAFERNDWQEMERHGNRAMEVAPDAPVAGPIAVALNYRSAAIAKDAAGMENAVLGARGVLEDDADNPMARGILVHHLINSDDGDAALADLDGILAARPDDLELHLARLRLVARMGDEAAIGDQLKHAFSLFPHEPVVQEPLLRWYAERGETDAAEALLREIAALTPDEPDGYVSLVRFIEQSRGSDAALDELGALFEAAQESGAGDLYRSMAAAMVFDAGDRDDAIGRLRAVVEAASPTDQRRNIQIMLARMLGTLGDGEGARGLVAEVLTEDATHVEALKMRAHTAIEEDRASEAVSDLRRALDQDPDDPEILTLMAVAHEREGSLELAGERLALAVDLSGAAVPESVRYTRFLLAEGRLSSARQVVTNALRGAPDELELATLFAETLVRQEDWGAVDELRAGLRNRTEPQAEVIVEMLTTALMLSRDRAEETARLLDQRVRDGSFEGARRDFAVLALLRAREADFVGARAAVAEALEAYPGDPHFRMLDVSLDLGSGEELAAEEKLRALLAAEPGARAPLNELLRLLREQGRDVEAADLIEEQLREQPESRRLRAIHGGMLAELGRIDDAIAVLEEVYAEDTSDVIVANNLASVLATHRGDDAEALERAATIARRLRGRDVPAFQDTYGWIEFLRGNIPDALAHLEPAAAGLPSDALVQYHLGRAYEATGRSAEARVQYKRALDVSRETEIESLPQFGDASERLAALPDALAPGK